MIKRLIDLVGAVCGIAIAFPLMLTMAILIRVKLGRPILFVQTRPGLWGAPFRLYKFRSMQSAPVEERRLVPDEARLTSFGRWLRSTSLDELPELFNVLKGDMSLVGPRPLLMQYLSRYSTRQARRHELRPGITGWAQVNGRNAISWERKLELDVWYVENQSFWLDVKILALTLAQVMQRRGVSAPAHVTMPEFMGSTTLYQRPIGRRKPINTVKNLLVVGAGGHARVVIDAARTSAAWNVCAILDDNSELWGRAIEGITVTGRIGDWPSWLNRTDALMVALGNNRLRREIQSAVTAAGLASAVVLHRAAVVATSAAVGGGTVVMAGGIINSNAKIGLGVIVNTGATIDHDCDIGDWTHIGPGVALAVT